jgi:hypothetical protein
LAGYTKLFGSILDSSVWREPPLTRIVWLTLLAMADRDGLVEASLGGIADRARVKLAAVETAMECFLSPDPDSKNPANGGRRVERTSSGYRLLNYEFYRQKQSAAEMRAKNAERQARFRERQKKEGVTSNVTSREVTPVDRSNDIASASPSPSQKAETDPDPERPPDTATRRDVTSQHRAPPFAAPRRIPQVGAVSLHFLRIYDLFPNKNRKNQAAQTWQELAESFPGGEVGLAEAIGKAFAAGYLKRHPYNGEPRYCPKLETFLAERCWEEPESKSPNAVEYPKFT